MSPLRSTYLRPCPIGLSLGLPALRKERKKKPRQRTVITSANVCCCGVEFSDYDSDSDSGFPIRRAHPKVRSLTLFERNRCAYTFIPAIRRPRFAPSTFPTSCLLRSGLLVVERHSETSFYYAFNHCASGRLSILNMLLLHSSTRPLTRDATDTLCAYKTLSNTNLGLNLKCPAGRDTYRRCSAHACLSSYREAA
ncbi:uncharacterized protein LY79DRAFT_96267 [Colletotrichum navitas]|uniref:Uncharacterized protein n=1 Tax=Colletotrichum navitas TaxID=681940 RepID=A0AAD8UXL9_9PEZI|nr:uncharacterized protein LY79DRAFT_96267 [Colletotrichum navitas]KAK1566418.1 hypothetical protein LY79DRAFT_96267 [Colletotrichum navitas]